MRKKSVFLLLALALLGIYDAGYLTYEHYRNVIPPCSTSIFVDCGRVLRSSYAVWWGVPLAAIGLAYYTTLTGVLGVLFRSNRKMLRYWLVVQSTGGFVFSLYFMYLQLEVIKSICLYCTCSALISTTIFVLVQKHLGRERKELFVFVFGLLYRNIVKPIFFLFDAEKIHTNMVIFGEYAGSNVIVKPVVSFLTTLKQPVLQQTIAGIQFDHPIGLAAGFDYEARLTQSLDAWGFGFQTVGTITNHPYEGNPHPMLGRLPQSKSLLVNKGFKNLGAAETIERLQKKVFPVPVGISIGRTNSRDLKTQKESIEDIMQAFTAFEQSSLPHSYYELNISCPNLFGDITFYPPQNLKELLIEIDKLHIARPIFVKMPIEKSNDDVVAMLEIISHHSPKGVIFGNLQKDRNHPTLVPGEVAKWQKGNFSGKPTYERSNELISLAYRQFKDRFVIVGCGGIFSAADAYDKISRGASLVQLITGMIFEGPQLIAQINLGLEEIIRKSGHKHISDAVGSAQP